MENLSLGLGPLNFWFTLPITHRFPLEFTNIIIYIFFLEIFNGFMTELEASFFLISIS